MDPYDQVYADIVFKLFGIELRSEQETDDFFNNIKTKLSKVQIAQLQEAIAQAHHDGTVQKLIDQEIQKSIGKGRKK